MTYPSQPTGPRKTGYVIGTLLVVLGIGGGTLAIVLGALTAVHRVEDYQRVPVFEVPGDISFSKTGRYNAYYEHPGISKRSEIPTSLTIELTGQGRSQSISLDQTSTTEHYDYGGHEGVRISGFTISAPGSYQVRVVSSSDNAASRSDQIAFGKGSVGVLLGGVLGGLFGGGLVAFIGLIVLIVTGVRRRSFRKRMAYGTFGGYAPPGAQPGPWPPAGPGQPGPWPPAGPGAPGGQPQPPPGWAPPPGPPQPVAQPQQPAWPPAPPSSSGPPSAQPQGPGQDPDRPGWGGPGQ